MKTTKQIAWTLSLGLAAGLWITGCATKQPAGTTAAAAGAKTETNAANPLHLAGAVVDAAGQPVAGATVELFQHGTGLPGAPELKRQTVTGANGAFEAWVPRETTYLVARKTGLAPAWKQWHPMAQQNDLRFVLTPPSSLAGVVVDEADKPVAGAEVFVTMAFQEGQSPDGGSYQVYLDGKTARRVFSTRTGPDGKFRIEGFPANATANLGVTKPGKVMRSSLPEYFNSDDMQCRAGDKDIQLVVEPAGSIEGRVIAQDTGKPLPGVRLFAQPDQNRRYFLMFDDLPVSGADGAFRIADLAAGSYQVHATFGTNTPPDWVAENVAVSVEAGQAIRDVKIVGIRGGILEVAVLSKKDRQPLGQINVNAYREQLPSGAMTASNGIALFRLIEGVYQISASRETTRSENVSATVENGKTSRVEIELAPPMKLAGIVRRPDGKPAAGLEVRVVSGYFSGKSIVTDAGGRFEMDWNPNQFGGQERNYCLFVRDAANNLAAAQDVDEDTGPLDLRLEPGLTIVGGAVSAAGQPLTNATAALVFWTGNSGMWIQGLATSNVQGRFEISGLPPGRRYGLHITAPGYGAKDVSSVESEAGRAEVEPVELKPANLKIAGQVLDQDDKPVAGTHVSMYGDGQPNSNSRTDREGRFKFDQVCEGRVQLWASAQNASGNISVEGGDTNVVLRLGQNSSGDSGSSSRKLKGTVTGPDGKPAAGVQVAIFPSDGNRWIKTGAGGTFNLSWEVQSWRQGEPMLVARDTTNNLAASKEIGDDVTETTLELKPGAIVTGRVQTAAGTPLARAVLDVMLVTPNSSDSWNEKNYTADAEGKFEVTSLPAGPRFQLYASAPGFGRVQQEINIVEDTANSRVDLGVITLKPADRVLAGQVVNDEEKPVSGAQIQISGNDQPQASTQTDRQGRFKLKVCEGRVRLFVHKDSDSASTTLEAGDTNAVITLASRRSYSSGDEAPRRRSLQGQPLPDLTLAGLTNALPAGQPGLLCLLDAEQRPLRRLLRLLSEQHDALKQQGLTVAAIQAAVLSDDSWAGLKDSVAAPFPVGRVTEKSAKIRWATEVTSLPWLILVNKDGKVAAEGFALEELDAKLKELGK